MDLVTHALTGIWLAKVYKYKEVVLLWATLVGALLPDIGEILIQRELSIKYGEKIAVYDTRTSDSQIAGTLSVTWLYDLLHSPLFSCTLVLGSLLAYKRQKKNSTIWIIISRLGIGMLSNTLLDSFTHGKVWALKLLFPVSQKRFPIFADEIGNWWDWTPKFLLPLTGFSLPYICLLVWTIMITLIIITDHNKR